MIYSKQGFTLLELLMAISIFSMVIGLAYSSYNATFQIINNAESQTETYSKARTAMERIMGDLESCYPGKEMVFKGTSESLGGRRADTLRFFSTAQIRLRPDAVNLSHVFIQYQVQEDPNSDSLLLFRKELSGQTEDETEDDPGLLLCDTLQAVAFDYRNKDGEDVETWGDEEENTNDTAALPDLITVSLRFNDGEEEETGTLFKTSMILPVAKKNND